MVMSSTKTKRAGEKSQVANSSPTTNNNHLTFESDSQTFEAEEQEVRRDAEMVMSSTKNEESRRKITSRQFITHNKQQSSDL